MWEQHLLFGFTEAPFYIATKTLLLLKKNSPLKIIPFNNSDDTVRHLHARCYFHKAFQ